MNEMRKLLEEITTLTLRIETEYPELYQYLDEDPLTLPVSKEPHIDRQILKEYLQSLKELLAHHLDTHENGLKQSPESV